MPITRNDNPMPRRPIREREVESDEKPSPFSIAAIRGGFGQGFWMKAVMMLMILIFAGGFLFAGLQTRMDGSFQGENGAPTNGTVARVGDQEITRVAYENAVQRQEQQMTMFGQPPAGVPEYFMMRRQALEAMTAQLALYNAARAAGFEATDGEIDARIEKEMNDTLKAQKEGGNEANFRRALEAKGMTEAQYVEDMKKDIDREAVARLVATEKYEKSVKDAVKTTAADYEKSQTRLDVRQIVIRPKAPDAKATDAKTAAQKTKADAKARAEKIAAQLKAAPASTQAALFAQLAKTQSDDTFTKTKGGALGAKLPAELPLPQKLRDALQNSTTNFIGPMTPDENSGEQYLFYIAGRKFVPPADYAKKKAELIKAYGTQRGEQAWQETQTKIAQEAKVEIEDPALKAYDLLSTQMSKPGADANALRTQAMQLYEEALPAARGTRAAAIRYQLAGLYQQANQPEKRLAMLQEIVKTDATPNMRIELARALRESKQKDAALTQLQQASKELATSPAAPSMGMMMGGNPADMQRFQIASEYEQLGRRDLATAERKKVRPAVPQGMGAMGMPGGGMQGLPPGVQVIPKPAR